jgi:hypothetical protein
MREYNYFKQTTSPNIHAALVGTSKIEWKSVGYNDSIDRAFSIMKENEFDVIPRLDKDNGCSKYIITKQWGKYNRDEIEEKQIGENDCIYYLTQLSDVIKLLNNRNQKFFFLTNHTEVIGLISISNLSCKHVYLYFYNKISLLERNLGVFIKKYMTADQVIDFLNIFGEKDEIPSALDTVRRYKEDSKAGLDSDIIEYLYLSDIFLLIKENKLYNYLEYKDSGIFEKQSGKLNRLRATIAHPNQSLIRERQSLEDVWKVINKIEELNEKLLAWAKKINNDSEVVIIDE